MTSDSTPTLDHILDRLHDGSYVELRSWDAVNAAMIRHWCDVLGIRNSRYTEGAIVAPVAMLYSWVMPNFEGRYPDGDGRDLLREASLSLGRQGYAHVLAVRLEQDYKRPIACGARLLRRSRIESISSRKRTWLGDGYFITERISFTHENGDAVADARMTLLCYRSSAKERIVRRPVHDISPAAGGGWPIIRIEITARLIAAIAIATRDYQDVHLDAGAARAAGARDIFLNILGTAGLVQRCVEQWMGPLIHLTRLDLRLLTPVYPGDWLSFSLISKENSADGAVTLKVSGALSRGLHVEAFVTARAQIG